MALSSDLISQFVKATRDTTKQQTESTVQGTAVLYKGKMHARIDGSDLLTPINQTTDIKEGDRVTILIKNHTATATGNISSPAARTDDLQTTDKKVEEAAKDISKFQIIMAAEVNTTDLEAITATIESLKAKTASFESMTAITADIQKLQAKYAELEYVDADTVKALNADIDSIKARIAEISDLTVEDLDAMNANIDQLKAYNAEFTYVSADVLEALKANIKELEVKKLTAEQADLKYANIDFANINMESVKKLFSESGIIKDLVVSEGKITGELVGVTIKGDLIEGNTVKADKLVVKGSDGLYYKLNIEGGATTSEQVTEEDLQNGLSGSIIVAKSVTAEKVAVDDLVAFDATIGGFNITEDSIYSGVKESVDNTTRGIYLDKTGQVAFGDADNYLKFYKDADGKWKLEIASNSLIMSSRKTTVEDALSKVEATAIVKQEEQFYKSTSHVSLIGGDWSTEQPVWEEGYYIWRRTAVTYGNGDSEYLPSSTGVCITGNTGAQGLQGLQGPQGEQGIQGPKGDTGSDGKTSHFHIKYSDVANPTSSSQMTETPSKYIGTYVDFTEADSTNPKMYTWSRFEGLQGEKGIPGQNGIDGKTRYLHIKYSNDGGTTFTANNGETPGDYIGQYTDFTEADSTNVDSYTWSKIKGEQGIQGPQGLQGEKGEQGIQGPKGDTGATGTGYTVLLSNESHTFPGSTSAAIASSESTNIIAYKNTSQVAANVTKIGSTTVSGNVSGVATGIAGLTATVENNGTTTCKITFHATTSLTAASGSIAITITVDGKTFIKNFSFSLSLKGGTGTAAKAVDIVASSQVFKSTDGGKTFSPDTITLTPTFQGGVTYSKWNYSTDGGVNWTEVSSGSHGLTISNSVLTITKSSDLYNDEVTSVSFKCISSDSAYFDVVTVVKLYDVMDLEVGGRNLLSDTRDFGFTDTTGVALNANPNAVLNNEIYEQCAVRYYSGTLSGNTSNSVIVEYKTLTPRYGQSYTLSFWAKGIGNFRTYFYGGSGYVDVESFVASDGTTGTTHDGSKAWTLTEDWKRYWITYTLKSSGDVDAGKYVLIRHDGNLCSDLTISVAGLKLELGNIATDWTPAPEDTELQITNAVSRINDIVSDSKLTPNEKTIAKKEWLVIEDEYPNYIEQAVAYGVITTEYTDAYNALDSYLNSEENGVLFDMTVTTDINSGVFTNHFKNYYNCKVKLSNYISKYSGLSGRNLIIGSGTMGDDYDVCTNDPIIVEDGCNGQKAVKTTKAWSGYYIELQEIANRNDIDTGDTVTVSIYVSTDSENEVNNHLYLFRGQNENDTTRDFETVTLNKGTWSRLAHTFTINDASVLSNKMRFECNVDTGYGLLWSCPKVEIGNKLTDWSPAPEDLDKALADAEVLIKKNIEAISSLTDRDFKVEFTNITEYIKTVDGKLTSYTEKMGNWMRFDPDGNLVLGSTRVDGQDAYELKLTKNRISFMLNDSEVAYINGNELYITDSTVLKNMKIGGFTWEVRGNGNLGLVYR